MKCIFIFLGGFAFAGQHFTIKRSLKIVFYSCNVYYFQNIYLFLFQNANGPLEIQHTQQQQQQQEQQQQTCENGIFAQFSFTSERKQLFMGRHSIEMLMKGKFTALRVRVTLFSKVIPCWLRRELGKILENFKYILTA